MRLSQIKNQAYIRAYTVYHYYQTNMLYKYNNGGEKLKNAKHPYPLSVVWHGARKSGE